MSYYYWKEFDSVGYSFLTCDTPVDSIAPVMFLGRAEVPPVGSMWCPCATNSGFVVHDDSGSGWCEWGSVEIEGSVELRFGGESGIDSRPSEEV